MCEFCSFGPNSNNIHGRDTSNPSFAGFFSSDAIEAAIQKVSISSKKNASNSNNDDDDDDDGTQ